MATEVDVALEGREAPRRLTQQHRYLAGASFLEPECIRLVDMHGV
jgi:hypothetical protein